MATSAADLKANAAKRRKTTTVEIDGLGAFCLRSLSAGDAVRFQSDVKRLQADGGDAEALAFTLIARSLIDDEGNPLMAEADAIEFAKSLDPSDYNTLAKAALSLNGLTETAVEDATKN